MEQEAALLHDVLMISSLNNTMQRIKDKQSNAGSE